MHQTNR